MTVTSRAAAPQAGPGTTVDWDTLAADVTGRVFLPGSPGFRAGSELFNTRYADRAPAAVVSVAGTEDVRRAIRWARDNEVPVVARSGGHSFAGYSVNDGLVIDMSRMALASADGSTGLVTVGGGTRVGHVYDAVRPYEMAIPTGTSPLVGMAGLALGGGCAYASRRLGLTLDALVQTTVVTADGAVLTCSAEENPDLFWACRGGGGGNFGINVSFVFQAHPVSDVTTFELTWRWADATAVLVAMQQVLEAAPDEFSVRMGASTRGSDATTIRDNVTVTTVGQFAGPARELAPLLDPVLSVATPLAHEVVERTYWEANAALVHATSADRFAMRTRYATSPIPADGLAELLSWVERWPGSGNTDGGGVGMFAWGGRINRVAPDATAFVHRDTLFLASMDTSWTAADPPEQVAANLHWLDGFYEAMGEYLTDSAYQNFPDPALGNWAKAYYGANYPRLQEVKRTHDPDNVFHHDQSIQG
ncbi:MAG TPA: FAD-binding oxidoreductase [Pseudonocardia sp.]|nr:FAD-binding oxidoreductase [Pseudonocardia sp.]